MAAAPRRIVILGGGFAGLAAALALDRSWRVTLVDRRPAFEFLPNIHELVSGVKTPELLRLPLRPILRRAGHAFARDEVVEVDGEARRVRLARGRSLRFDALIVALGGENATHGVAGVTEYALPFKSVDDCVRIRDRLAALADTGETSDVAIVGGGLEGVEALGEILRRWRAERRFRLHLVEGRERLLPEAPAALDRRTRALAAQFGVRVETGERVRAVEAACLRLASGRRTPSRATIWTGGPAPSQLLAASGLAPRAGAWAPVDERLLSRSLPRVFVAGDAAELPEPLAKQAYHALDMGRAAARNAAHLLLGRPLRRYRPAAKPTLVSFGDLDCFLVAGGRVVASPALAAAKEAVFQLVMAQLDRASPVGALRGATDRLWAAAQRVAWPAITSPGALRRQLRISIGGA
jgi:NADH dehydrogenase